MKRILSLLLVLVMCLGVCSLAGCQLTPGTGTTSTTTEPTTPPVDVMAQAKVLVRELYKDSAVAPKKDYTLVSQIVVAGETYPVTWSVDTDLVTISEEPVDGFYVVDLPASNETEVAYVLTATITVGEDEGTVTFERTLPLINYVAVTELEENVAYKLFFDSATLNQMLYALAKPSTTENKYIDTTNDPKAAPDYFAEKVDGGYKFYTTDANGNKLYVNPNLQMASDGHWSKYLGLAESTEAVFTYNADKEAWVVTLEGTEYYMGTYNTYNTFSISESSHLPSDTSFPGGFLTKADAEALAPDAPPAVEIPTLEGATKPEVGQKYLAGMAKNDKAYYLTGSMQATYYFGTATNSTLGINCYVEAADNGYYLYAIIQGAKKYINVTVSGTHVNCNYQDTAATVWTWNDTLKTLETSVDGTAYIMGTQAIGTYTTVGMVKAADENNYIQFVPSTNPDQEAPSGQPITIPEALALEDGAAVVVKGTVSKISYAWNGSSMSITITDGTSSLDVYKLATQVALGDVITVTGTMDTYNSARQIAAGATAEIVEKAPVEMTIPEAVAAADGTAVIVTGTVKEINYNWSDSSKNMSITIEDADGNTLYIYKLATQVALGDKVVITGKMGTYNNARQIAAGATAEIYVAPTVITTIPEALAAADGTDVELTGTVTIVNYAWSDSNNNMSVTIEDADGNTIYIYKLATKVGLGDKITVTGKMGTYNGRQIAAGATAEIVEKAPVEMTIPEAVAAADGTAVIVTGTVKEINYNWSDSSKNMSITIEDADGNTLYIYKLATQVALGDKVVITGKMGTYNNARQIAAGATAEIIPQVTEPVLSLLAKFGFITNYTAADGHKDGKDIAANAGNKYEANNYTLEFTDFAKVYYTGQDAKGNAAIKFGASSAAGSLSFTVPEDVDYVIIYVAGYKANTGRISINGGEAVSTTTVSNNGEYAAIKIDTTTNKTVTVATVSGGYRIMMSCVEFYEIAEN